MNNIINSYIFGLGAKKDKQDKRDYRIAGIMAPEVIPKQRFFLEEKFTPKNQFSRGSCTSQAQAHHKERQEGIRCAARFVMALTKKLEGNTQYGAYTRDTFKVVNKYGICSEKLLPEPPAKMSWGEYINVDRIPQICYDEAAQHKSKSYWRVTKNIDEIRRVLVNKRVSVVISSAWYGEFNQLENGFLPMNYNHNVRPAGHATEICGFDDFEKYLYVKNSWNGWGLNGYYKMRYDLFGSIVWDCWSSLDIPPEMPVDNYYGQKRTWRSYLKERKMAFNPWLVRKIKRLPNNREIKALVYGFWSYEAVFKGKYNDLWLKYTKPEAKKKHLI